MSMEILSAPRQLVMSPSPLVGVGPLGLLTRVIRADVSREDRTFLKQETASLGHTVSDHTRALIMAASVPHVTPPLSTKEQYERWIMLLVEWASVDPDHASLSALVQHTQSMDGKLALLVDALMTRTLVCPSSTSTTGQESTSYGG